MRQLSTWQYMRVMACSEVVIQLVNLLVWISLDGGPDPRTTEVGCKFMEYFFFCATHLAVYMLIAMTVEKFTVVRKPLQSLGNCERRLRQSYIVSVTIVVIVLGINSHHFWTSGLEDLTGDGVIYCGVSNDKYYTFLYTIHPILDTIFYCLVPSILLVTLNSFIIFHLRDPKHLWRNIEESPSQKTEPKQPVKDIGARKQSSCRQVRSMRSVSNNRYNWQATRMILVVTFAFVIGIFPVGIITVCEMFDYFWSSDNPGVISRRYLLSALASNLMYTNHAINFWLYCASGSKFRAEFKSMMVDSCRDTDRQRTESATKLCQRLQASEKDYAGKRTASTSNNTTSSNGKDPSLTSKDHSLNGKDMAMNGKNTSLGDKEASSSGKDTSFNSKDTSSLVHQGDDISSDSQNDNSNINITDGQVAYCIHL